MNFTHIAFLAVLSIGSAVSADTIYISPAQCVDVIGSQRVCATSNSPIVDSAAKAANQQRTHYVCNYGKHEGSTVPDIPSYALVEILIQANGNKVETVLRDFGNNGKKACEEAADKMENGQKSSAVPAPAPQTAAPIAPEAPATPAAPAASPKP